MTTTFQVPASDRRPDLAPDGHSPGAMSIAACLANDAPSQWPAPTVWILLLISLLASAQFTSALGDPDCKPTPPPKVATDCRNATASPKDATPAPAIPSPRVTWKDARGIVGRYFRLSDEQAAIFQQPKSKISEQLFFDKVRQFVLESAISARDGTVIDGFKSDGKAVDLDTLQKACATVYQTPEKYETKEPVASRVKHVELDNKCLAGVIVEKKFPASPLSTPTPSNTKQSNTGLPDIYLMLQKDTTNLLQMLEENEIGNLKRGVAQNSGGNSSSDGGNAAGGNSNATSTANTGSSQSPSGATASYTYDYTKQSGTWAAQGALLLPILWTYPGYSPKVQCYWRNYWEETTYEDRVTPFLFTHYGFIPSVTLDYTGGNSKSATSSSATTAAGSSTASSASKTAAAKTATAAAVKTAATTATAGKTAALMTTTGSKASSSASSSSGASSSKAADSLLYEMSFFTQFDKHFEDKDIKLNLMASYTYNTDVERVLNIQGAQLDIEMLFHAIGYRAPDSHDDFSPPWSSKFALGYLNRLYPWPDLWDSEKGVYKDYINYQLRLYFHSEGGDVLHQAATVTVPQSSFIRMGPVVQLKVGLPDLVDSPFIAKCPSLIKPLVTHIIKPTTLSFEYHYLPPVVGPSAFDSELIATAEYDLIGGKSAGSASKSASGGSAPGVGIPVLGTPGQTSDSAKLALSVTYTKGSLIFSKEEVNTLIFGLSGSF